MLCIFAQIAFGNSFYPQNVIGNAQAHLKKGRFLYKIKFKKMAEGKCIQILYRGPYSTEPESLAKMEKLMGEERLIKNGFHHEIYLSDPRRVPEEKWKTILRQLVKEESKLKCSSMIF